jgi:SAM-dependent methyltransferase
MAKPVEDSFVPGFYEFHVENFGHRTSVADVAETSINAANGASAVDYVKIAEKFSVTKSSVRSLLGYTSRIVPTYQMLEMFRDSSAGAPHGKVLDIGCGRGVHLRLLKAWGLIDEAVGIDIYDHCSGFDESCLPRLHRRFKLLRFLESWQDRIALTPRSQWTSLQHSVMWKIPTARRFADDYGHRPDRGIYALSMKKPPKMDRFIVGNVFELDEKFDVVTSFASMDWFSADSFLAKVSALINDGGYFYVWVTNWWHAINTTNIFGHMPFAAQRLTKDALSAYAKAHLPEHHDAIMKSYSYFDPSHPTLADLVDVAGRHGLVPVSWKQNVLPKAVRHRGGLSSLGVAKNDHPAFEAAYTDSQTLHPTLRRLDMYPYSNAILFQKPGNTSGFTKARFDGLRDEILPPQNDGAAMRALRRFGGWVFR